MIIIRRYENLRTGQKTRSSKRARKWIIGRDPVRSIDNGKRVTVYEIHESIQHQEQASTGSRMLVKYPNGVSVWYYVGFGRYDGEVDIRAETAYKLVRDVDTLLATI